MNRVNIPQWAIELGIARYGVMTVDPATTALVVVDLQNAFMVPGQVLANSHACDIVPNVNTLARKVRETGGVVVFSRHTVSDEPRFELTEWQARVVPRTETGDFQFRSGTFGHQLYAKLDVLPTDLQVEKHRLSPFLPNSSDLDAELRKRGIDTLIITGTVTNACCESTARDAHMLGYKVVFVSDATAAMSDEEHNATLLSMVTVFGAVRSTSEVLELLEPQPVRAAMGS